WPREERRGKGVVDEKGHAAFARCGADRLDVRHAAQGVRDGLGDDEPGAGQLAADRVEVQQVDEADFVPGRFEVPTQHRGGPAVQLAGGDDGGRPWRQSEDRAVQRRHAGGRRHAGFGAFQFRDRPLEHLAVAVRVSAVVIAGPLPACDGVVIVKVGEDVDRGGAQVGRQRTARAQVAARVDRTRRRLQGYPLNRVRPAYAAASPSSASIWSRRLYFATRSDRAGAPVLIIPAPVATTRSAMVVSSVSPERCEITAL